MQKEIPLQLWRNVHYSYWGGAYTDSGKSLGQVDLPWRQIEHIILYYIIFENIAPLGENKQTVDIWLWIIVRLSFYVEEDIDIWQ
jgi:hypothetical protein